MNLFILKLRRLALRMSLTEVSMKSKISIIKIIELEKGNNKLAKEEFNRVLKVYDITEPELYMKNYK